MTLDRERYDDPEQLADALQLLADLVRKGVPGPENFAIRHGVIDIDFHSHPDGLRAWAALLGVEPSRWRHSGNYRTRRIAGEYEGHRITGTAFDDPPGVVVVQIDDAKLQQDDPVRGRRWDGELPASLAEVPS